MVAAAGMDRDHGGQIWPGGDRQWWRPWLLRQTVGGGDSGIYWRWRQRRQRLVVATAGDRDHGG